MCDTSGVPPNFGSDTAFDDDPSPETLHRPETPLPDHSRALCRTASYSSIKTVHPRANKGIRRRITKIVEDLKQKAPKKENLAMLGIPNIVTHALGDAPASKAPKYERKATAPLQQSPRRSEDESVSVIHDRLYCVIPSVEDVPSIALLCNSDSVLRVGAVLPSEGDKDSGLPDSNVERGAHAFVESDDIPLLLKANINDIRLEIVHSEPDVTIWDGLQASHHAFRCHLYLRCITHPCDSVAVPDVRRIDMTCHTHPPGSRYARPPALQATYEGRSRSTKKQDGSPDADLETEIKIDKHWRTAKDDRGTWGWFKEVFVPLSSSLFDKMEYRQFKLASQLWIGESCVEGDLTFGISMLLRGIDMS